MRILMVGAGSVGGFIGAHLAHVGEDISFLLRPKTYKAIQANGLTLETQDNSITVHPKITTDPSNLPSPDVIMLGVKCYDLDETIEQLRPIIKSDTVILTFQNGVNSEERLNSAFQGNHVVAGVIYVYTKIIRPGLIAHLARGNITIGEESGKTDTPRIQALKNIFSKTPIPCKVTNNIAKVKWEKMCWNVVFNPLTVLLNDNVAKALDHDTTLSLIRSIVQETVLVAEKFGVKLSHRTPDNVISATQEIRSIHTSMFDDWKAGRKTEIEYLNGYLVHHAHRFGIQIPVNETLYRLIKTITSSVPVQQGIIKIEGTGSTPTIVDQKILSEFSKKMHVEDSTTIIGGLPGKGIKLKEILESISCDVDADHITFYSSDGHFSASLTLEEAKKHGIIIYELDGHPIPIEKGGPFRLATPGLGNLCANVKHLARIEITHGIRKDTRPSLKP